MTSDFHQESPVFELPSHLIPIGQYMWELFMDATEGQIRPWLHSLSPIRESGWFPISAAFTDFLNGDILKVAEKYNLPEGLSDFRTEEPLACCFYLINSLHETLLPDHRLDRYERYPYEESIQYANQITEINYCQNIFDEIYSEITGQIRSPSPSKIFWTHDIDYLYSSWKANLILKWRKKSLRGIPKIICNRILRKDRWDNIGEILRLEEKHRIQSAFFWLTARGKLQTESQSSIDHADYDIDSKEIKAWWSHIEKSGSINGLHKSAFSQSITDEIKALPHPVSINRNHFLKARFPHHYHQIEKAQLNWDSTLGFAEHIGFRNSYGRPFRPYHLAKNRPFTFHEIPLHIMDTSLIHYMDIEKNEIIPRILHFIEKNSTHSVITILLHNIYLDHHSSFPTMDWDLLYSKLSRFSCFLPT